MPVDNTIQTWVGPSGLTFNFARGVAAKMSTLIGVETIPLPSLDDYERRCVFCRILFIAILVGFYAGPRLNS